MANRNKPATDTDTTVETVEIFDMFDNVDDYGTQAVADTTPLDVTTYLNKEHFKSIPWARPANMAFKDRPQAPADALWHHNSIARLHVALPEDLYFKFYAYSALGEVPYIVTAITLEQALVTTGNENKETRKVWHLVLRGSDKQGRTHPAGRLMWNITSARSENGTEDVALTGNKPWGVPSGRILRAVERNGCIKAAIEMAKDGKLPYKITETTRTIGELYHELFNKEDAGNGNGTADIPTITSQDVLADTDTVGE